MAVPATRPPRQRRPTRLPRYLLISLMLLYALYFGLYAGQRHLAFETGAFDTGVYAQPLWNFTQGRGFAVSLIEDNGPLRWATHIEPILFLIAPLYALWPDPRLLFWLQVSALSLAAVPLYALAARRLGNEWAALAIVLAYFLLPAAEAVTLFDFHAVTLAPLFLLSAIYFLDRALAARGHSFWLWPTQPPPAKTANRSPSPHSSLLTPYSLSALFFLLALSTKEDISLHVFMIGAYLLLLRRRWPEGVALIGVGLIWFYLAFQVIIPAYRTAGGHSIYAAWFETLGDTPLEIALSPLTAPDKVLALIFRPGSLPALAMITVPLALLPWLGLPLFGLAAPSLAFSLLSQNPTLRQLETWHYAAPMLPFVMLGAVDGLARLRYYGGRLLDRLWPQRDLAPALLPGLIVLLLVTALSYHHLRGYSPLARLPEWPTPTEHHRLGRELAAQIPPEASVLAQAQLIPHVAHRTELAIWRGPLDPAYDYIWLDLSHPKFPNRFNAHGELLTGLVIEPSFGVVAAQDGYLLLKNGAPKVVIEEDLFSFTQFETPPPDAQPFQAHFGQTFTLLGVRPEARRLATSETEPQAILYFETNQTPRQDYHLFIYLLAADGSIVGATDYPQPALFWWPTSRWQAGDRRQVRANSFPWWTGDRQLFGYAVGLSRSADPWDAAARLPISLDPAANPPGIVPLEGDTLLPIAAFRRVGAVAYPAPVSLLPLPSSAVDSSLVSDQE